MAVLRELVKTRRTGELICAQGASEAHVYMQLGRVAWGTDTEHPFAFGRRIAETCGITRERLAELVAECRTEKTALGETLVARGLATPSIVREALRHQAILAIRALIRARDGECAFFERRGFSSYDKDLTFSLDELLAEEEDLRTALHPAPSMRPEGESIRDAQRMLSAVNGCQWAECYQGTYLRERVSQSLDVSPSPAGLLLHLLDDSVDFVGLRGAGGVVLGASLDGSDRSIWCGIHSDAPLGEAYATFAQQSGTERRSALSRAFGNTGTPRVLASDETVFDSTALGLMLRAPDVLGACHLIGDHASSLIARAGFEDEIIPSRISHVAEHVFSPEILFSGPCYQSQGLRTAVVGDGVAWAFGTELSSITGESVWLLTSRRVAPGFGWACLTAMVRELSCT